MTNSLKNQIIYHMKLSEMNMLIPQDRRLFRITGNVDLSREYSHSELVIFSEEENKCKHEKDLPPEFIEENFKFNFNYLKKSNHHQVFVDLTLLDEFKLDDINLHHDLIQFIGYKEQNGNFMKLIYVIFHDKIFIILSK
jgi:hypothetical protein